MTYRRVTGCFFRLFVGIVFDCLTPRMITSAPFMSSREIQDLAETVVDSLGFAADGGRLSGKLALSSLPRLFDALATREGVLDCELSGERVADAGGKPRSLLRLGVTGRLGLRCQRCLAEVSFDCAIDTRLLLIAEGEAWPEDEMESETYDAIPASRDLSVRELVEEEVLLALPLVPRHTDCLPPGGTESESAPSPFAALAKLKKH
jgi:uncharacterized protein